MVAKKKTVKKKPAKKSGSIMDRVKPVSEIQEGLTAVLYGRAGTGKTTISGTFPTPHLLLDIGEKGTDSIMTIKGLSVLRVISWQDIEDIYWEIKDNPDDWKTVTIDAMHSMQSLALMEAKRLNKKSPDDMLSLRDRGTASDLMVTWLTNFRDLQEDNINVIFLAHDRIFKEDTDAEDTQDQIDPSVGPKLMPAASSAILGLTKINGYTFIREEVTKPNKAGQKKTRKRDYCLRLGPHSYYATKVRSPKEFEVPAFIVDPTYDKLVEVLKGKPSGKPKTKRKMRK
jgi:hypothetical protein